jgi:hypothetical protein
MGLAAEAITAMPLTPEERGPQADGRAKRRARPRAAPGGAANAVENTPETTRSSAAGAGQSAPHQIDQLA